MLFAQSPATISTARKCLVLSAVLGSLSAYSSTASMADTSGDQTSGSQGAILEQIIVTAQKREEHLQDVPIPVTVLSATELADNNETKIADYYMQVPGLSFQPGPISTSLLSIRGITTGGQSPTATVGIMVDDVPFGATGGVIIPDIDPGDLARIEVLRGPQGTLYGASSMGGLLKFVTLDPSTDSVSGRVEAGTSSVYNGAEPGESFRASINLPLSSDLAVRASAFYRLDPGYIDNPVLGISGANEDHAEGGRVSALWRPTDTFSVKLSALYQDIRMDSTSDVTSPDFITSQPLTGLQQGFIQGGQASETKAQAYSATLMDKIGSLVLASITGFNVNHNTNTYDLTPVFGQLTQFGIGAFPGFGVIGTPANSNSNTGKATQEIRLSGPIGQKVDFLLGGYFTHERSMSDESINATDPYTGRLAGQWLNSLYMTPSTYTEYAAFADLTFHISDRFDVQIGGRDSLIKTFAPPLYNYGQYAISFFGVPSPLFIEPAESSKSRPFTYLFSPQFKISADLMVYARLASGYRPGGPNVVVPGVPSEFEPDKTNDYEIGAKGDFLDHTLSFDASVYYINWKDIQLALENATTGESYTGNGSSAKSQGVELTVESRPITGLKLAGWVTFSEAVLTQPLPPAAVVAGTYGPTGSPLPDSNRFSGNLSADEEFPVAARTTGYVGATVSYVGERLGGFLACANTSLSGSCLAPPPPRVDLPAYAKTDLRAGVKYDTWNMHFYANNLTNRLGILSGGNGTATAYNDFYIIQPRTVGISVSKTF